MKAKKKLEYELVGLDAQMPQKFSWIISNWHRAPRSVKK